MQFPKQQNRWKKNTKLLLPLPLLQTVSLMMCLLRFVAKEKCCKWHRRKDAAQTRLPSQRLKHRLSFKKGRNKQPPPPPRYQVIGSTDSRGQLDSFHGNRQYEYTFPARYCIIAGLQISLSHRQDGDVRT